jgi:hypothetical protein
MGSIMLRCVLKTNEIENIVGRCQYCSDYQEQLNGVRVDENYKLQEAIKAVDYRLSTVASLPTNYVSSSIVS